MPFKPRSIIALTAVAFFAQFRAVGQSPIGLWSFAALTQNVADDWAWSAKAETRWDAAFAVYDEHFLDLGVERALGKRGYIEGSWRVGQGANAFGLESKERASLRCGGTWEAGPVDVRLRAGYQKGFAHGLPFDTGPTPDKKVLRFRAEIRTESLIPMDDVKLSLSVEAFLRREIGPFSPNGARLVLKTSLPIADRGRFVIGYLVQYTPVDGWWSGIRWGFTYKLPRLDFAAGNGSHRLN